MAEPIKVLVVNPLLPSSKLITVKIMSGIVFGHDQTIDLTFLVYSNEVGSATAILNFKTELLSCAFSCYSSITIVSDLPRVSDYDVFCVSTDFPNPNYIDLRKPESSEQFDTLYLIIKLAQNFSVPDKTDKMDEEIKKSKEKKTKIKKPEFRKPIIMADGLATIDILKSMSKNLPSEIFFCPTPISAIARNILADYMQVKCCLLNNEYVWAANDEVFHVEFEKPFLKNEKVKINTSCDQDGVRESLKKLNLDSSILSSSWMKNEFVQKVASFAMKNPYGCIYRASVFAQTLRDIWIMRSQRGGMKINSNIGVISDGSLGTIKGCPYTLPITFDGESWTVIRKFQDDIHLKQEIRRMNKAAKLHHENLISYCKKFLQDNVIDMDEEGSESTS